MKVRTVAVAALAIALGGCSVTVSTDSETTASTSTAEATTTEPTPTTTTATTELVTTAPEASTTVTTEAAATLCEDFQSESAFSQMSAAKDGSAPSADQCPEAVTAATGAATVLDTTERLLQTSQDPNYQFLTDKITCDLEEASFTFANPFDLPVIIYGAVTVGEAEDNVDAVLKLFVSDVIAPGAEYVASASRKGYDSPKCFVNAYLATAATGDMAPDAGIVVPPPTGPQTSDDVNEWLPALLASTNASIGSMDDMVATVLDIHNPAIWGSKGGFVGGSAEDPIEICDTFDVTEGRDDTGQLALITRVADRGAGPGIEVGFYRRGSDKLWRWAEVPIFYQLPTTENLCDSAPSL